MGRVVTNQVILVFDAYNYLPLYILKKKQEENQLTIDVNDSLAIIESFLLDCVVADDKRVAFQQYTAANIRNHKTRNLVTGVLGELILATRYNLYNPEGNSEDLCGFLETTRIVIKDYFDKKVNVKEFFNYLQDKIRYVDFRGEGIKITVITIQFLRRILADVEYQNLFSHEKNYLVEVGRILQKISDAFDWRNAYLLQSLDQIFNCYLNLFTSHSLSPDSFPFESCLLILELLTEEDNKNEILELFYDSSTQEHIFKKVCCVVSDLYREQGEIPHYILHSLQFLAMSTEIADSMFQHWLEINKMLVKEILAKNNRAYKLNLISLLAILIKRQHNYLKPDLLKAHLASLLRIFEFQSDDDILQQAINVVKETLSELDDITLGELISTCLSTTDNGAFIYNTLNEMKNIASRNAQLINALAENLSTEYNQETKVDLQKERIVKLLLDKYRGQLSLNSSTVLLSILFMGMLDGKFKADATRFKKKNAFIESLIIKFKRKILIPLVNKMEQSLANNTTESKLIIQKLHELIAKKSLEPENVTWGEAKLPSGSKRDYSSVKSMRAVASWSQSPMCNHKEAVTSQRQLLRSDPCPSLFFEKPWLQQKNDAAYSPESPSSSSACIDNTSVSFNHGSSSSS